MKWKPKFAILRENFLRYRHALYVILSFISIFEVIMIIRSLASGLLEFHTPKLYLASYIILLVCSLLSLLLLIITKRNPTTRNKNITFVGCYIYVTIICAWSIFISYLDIQHGTFPIVFLTVFIAIPSFCLLDPIYFTGLTVAGTLSFILLLQYGTDPTTAQVIADNGYNDSGNIINLSVYCIITIIISWKTYKLTCANYMLEDNLRQAAKTDALTKLENRRGFDERIIAWTGREYTMIMIDVDNFKKINDQYGHHIGDEYLIYVAKLLNQNFPSENIFRYGGDEFAITSELEDEDIRARLDAINAILKTDASVIPIQISAGVYHVHNEDSDKDALLRADRALYRAKDAGRGCYIFYTGE